MSVHPEGQKVKMCQVGLEKWVLSYTPISQQKCWVQPFGKAIYLSVSIKNFKCAYPEASDSTLTQLFQRKHCHIKTKRHTLMLTAALFSMAKTGNNQFIGHSNQPHHLSSSNPSATSQGFQNNPNVFLLHQMFSSEAKGLALACNSNPIPYPFHTWLSNLPPPCLLHGFLPACYTGSHVKAVSTTCSLCVESAP